MARMAPSKCPRCGGEIKIKATNTGWTYDCKNKECKWHGYDRSPNAGRKPWQAPIFG